MERSILNSNPVSTFLCFSVLLLLSTSTLFACCNADDDQCDTDISCLKSIKSSFQDPLHHLSSWTFTNTSCEGFICRFVGVECWHADESRVLNINLRGMGLVGGFPWGIENCSSLIALDLSNNHLSGPIPFDISKKLAYVTYLDLSFNQFSGVIPPGIANCTYLNFLRLDNNRLEGPIPEQLGLSRRLKEFNVSNNHLSGPVPSFTSPGFPAEAFANNPSLCGAPLSECESDSDKRTFLVSGFMTGWAIATGLVIYVVLFAIPRKRVKKMANKNISDVEARRRLPKDDVPEDHKMSNIEKIVTRMSLKELRKTTSNFSRDNVIGNGKTGTMYKGVLPNGSFLCIKRLHDEKKFLAELVTLGRMRHQNLLPLVGFCCEENDKLLAYRFMPNGNLYEWLCREDNEREVMEWPFRAKIAVGTAKGVAWLHHNNSNIRVAHCRISSQCILLDRNFEPKLSNFWEAKYENANEISPSLSLDAYKHDVHCFGNVLLELITGKELTEITSSAERADGIHPSSPLAVVDDTLRANGVDDEMLRYLEIAGSCLSPVPSQRPTMHQVYERLSAIPRS